MFTVIKMEYRGKHPIFDPSLIRTYPLKERINKVSLDDLVRPDAVLSRETEVPENTLSSIERIAESVVTARNKKQPVIMFTGAHLIKNGLGPLLADLVERELVTLVAGNGATSIHDFELALIGETSEYVPKALGNGLFGMAYEFAFINEAVNLGNIKKLGLGEALGRMMCEAAFRNEVFSCLPISPEDIQFNNPEVSVIAACFRKGIPFTVHTGIGTDVIDQHPNFNGEAKGGCSGRDFLIYTAEVTGMTGGGVLLNVGSAVTGPEVFLKAASMAANSGHAPRKLIAADFDIRKYNPVQMTDENSEGYYFRDQKSVVTRIPDAFGGAGYYIQGNQRQTFPALYKLLIEKT